MCNCLRYEAPMFNFSEILADISKEELEQLQAMFIAGTCAPLIDYVKKTVLIQEHYTSSKSCSNCHQWRTIIDCEPPY